MKNKQNLKQFMRIFDLEMVTLINILNAKGVIYTHYKLKKERESYERDGTNRKICSECS